MKRPTREARTSLWLQTLPTTLAACLLLAAALDGFLFVDPATQKVYGASATLGLVAVVMVVALFTSPFPGLTFMLRAPALIAAAATMGLISGVATWMTCLAVPGLVFAVFAAAFQVLKEMGNKVESHL